VIPRGRSSVLPSVPPDGEPLNDPPPPVEHRAIDHDFVLMNGGVLTTTIIDGNGVLDELADQYIFRQGDENLTILKSAIAYVRRVERTFTTRPAAFE